MHHGLGWHGRQVVEDWAKGVRETIRIWKERVRALSRPLHEETRRSEFFRALLAVVRRPGFLLGIVVAIALAALWFIERAHPWANNWLPNLIAEWTGILLVVAILDELRRQRLEAQLQPLRRHCYREFLRWLNHFGLVASDYLEHWTAAGAELEVAVEAPEAVRRMDEAFARDAVPESNARRCWVEMLQYDAREIDELCTRYVPFLPPPVIVPMLALLNTMRASAGSFGEEKNAWDVGAYGSYVPIGDAFGPAYTTVTRALRNRS